MFKNFSKYSFLIIFGLAFLLFIIQIKIASAEVTCCACSNIEAISFECQDGGGTGCEAICTRGNSSARVIEGVRATGEVVTCCKCRNDSKVCNATSQECSALCGTAGFEAGGLQRRYPEPPATGETTKDEASKVELIPPNLNIDIPGAGSLFGGGQIVTEGEEKYFYLPYIGEYVSALYNYVLGIVGILAVVVIIFAGGIWLTAGGSPERIKTAQEYIFGAVTGVVLAFGSYLILYTINPDLVRFDAMKVKVVENIPMPEPHFSVGSENPRDPGDGGEYEVMARRIAEQYQINGCMFATQIGMESGWNPRSGEGAGSCFGLGQILWRNARNILSRNRTEIVEKHSQECPRCPQGNASQEEITNWLLDDPEGNLIIAAMLKKESLRSAANPIAAVSIYGMG